MDNTRLNKVETSEEASSSYSVKENVSLNKWKFVSNPPPGETSVDMGFENLEEKFRNAVSQLGLIITRESKEEEEEEEDESQQAKWEEPLSFELLDLLTKKLYEILSDATITLIALGYTEEAADWAILNTGLLHGSKDAVSNVVDGALALLRREKNFDTSYPSMFKELKNMVEFTFLEMIHVVKEIRPDYDIAEAMWGLMLSDLNLLTACKAPPKPKDKEASDGTDNSDSKITRNSEPENSACPIHQEPTSNSPSKEENSLAPQEAKGKTSMEDEKSGDSKKAGSSGDSKPQQKKLSFEKSYKGRTSKGTFKAKVSAWGSMTTDTDKKSKSQSGSSSAMSVKEALFGSNPETTPPTSSNPNPNPNPSPCPKEKKMERRSDPPKEIDFYAGIPYDKTFKKHIPQDYKDEAILILVPYMRALEKQLQNWTSWAQQKVVQALKRLGEDKAELTLLRQEKGEADKCARENEVVEETSRKRLHEMENALSLFNEQLQVLSSKIPRLEREKALFLKEKEAEHLKASMEAAKMEQTEIKEQENFKKVQPLDSERRVLLEEQRDIKRKTAELEGVVDKAKARYDQFEVLWKHEAKQREKTTAQKDSLIEKRKEGIALRKQEEKNINQMAERNVQKCEENIKSLEKKVSEMRLEADKLMIASLNIGYGSGPSTLPKVKKRLAVFEGNFGSLTPERECVMCMNEEKSVVFLPCAHQVLCEDCCKIHEQQGMNDCPSCRTIIEKRICAHYKV